MNSWLQRFASVVVLCVAMIVLMLGGTGAVWGAASTDEGYTLAGRFPADEVTSSSRGQYTVECLKKHAGMVGPVLDELEEARRTVARKANDAFLVHVGVVIAPDTETFVAMVGQWAENSSAVARPLTRQVVINADSVRRSGPAMLRPLLVHELAHLLVGVEVAGRLPRWMDEGIAMMLAGEWTAEDASAVSLAGVSRSTIPLRDLQQSFPTDQPRQEAAYRQSFAVVSYLVRERYGGSLPELLADLKARGAQPWWDPVLRQALETEWQRSLKGWPNFSLLTLHSGMLWWVLAGLTVVGAILVRVRRKRRWEAVAAEEGIPDYAADLDLYGEDGEEDDEGDDDSDDDHWGPGGRPHAPSGRFHRPSSRP